MLKGQPEVSFVYILGVISSFSASLFQQMAPAKQAKVIKEFQMQSAQMDMTVTLSFLSFFLSFFPHFPLNK